MNRSTPIIIVFAALLGIVSRLIFVHSNVFFLDGDEAILGMMSTNMLKGDLSLYFYGQNYGLSILESSFISLGILIFGHTSLAIKLPMLTLWLTSVIFLALGVKRIRTEQSLWLVLLLVSCLIISPTWLVWSMKARGGYLTSFLFSSWLFYLLTPWSKQLKSITWLIVGLFLVLIWEAQPLWFFPSAILVGYRFITTKGKLKTLGFIGGGVVSLGSVLFLVKQNIETAWETPSPSILSRMSEITTLPDVIMNNLGGNYFLSSVYEPSHAGYAKLVLAGILIFFAWVVLRSIRSRKLDLASILLLASLASLTGIFVKGEPRYMLPFYGFALLTLVSIDLRRHLNWEKGRIAVLSLFVVVGLFQLSSFKEYSFINMKINEIDKVVDEEEIMEDLIHILDNKGVKYVYSTNEFLAYQLNYLTGGRIQTVGRIDRTRTPWLVPDVVGGFKDNRSECAIIGYNLYYANSGKLPLLKNKVFYLLQPNDQLLQVFGLCDAFEACGDKEQ